MKCVCRTCLPGWLTRHVLCDVQIREQLYDAISVNDTWHKSTKILTPGLSLEPQYIALHSTGSRDVPNGERTFVFNSESPGSGTRHQRQSNSRYRGRGPHCVGGCLWIELLDDGFYSFMNSKSVFTLLSRMTSQPCEVIPPWYAKMSRNGDQYGGEGSHVVMLAS